MSVYRVAQCEKCGSKREVSSPPKQLGLCLKCGGPVRLSDKWYMAYTVAGKKYRQAVSTSKRFTEDALGKVKGQVREGRFFEAAARVTWTTAVGDFDVWMDNNVAARTRQMYRLSLSILKPSFERYTIDQITPQMVERFKADRIAAGKKNTTVNRDIATIKRLFSLCEEQFTTKDGRPYVEVNRIRKVKLLSERSSKRTRWLTEEEIERLLWATRCPVVSGNVRKWIITLMALETGLRKESIVSLRRQDVDLKSGVIHCTIKGGKRHKVQITQKLRKGLREYQASQKVLGPYLFPSENHGNTVREGEHIESGSRFGFETALKAAYITGCTFHDLRHTFATHMYRHTRDFKALQIALGHEDFSITMNRYAHLMDDGMAEAMKKFEERG